MNYNWNWGIFWEMSADGRHTWFMTLIMGLGWTLATAFCAGIIAFILGSFIGVVRTMPIKWAVRIGNAYVELFRNIPLLVQLFLWFFVLPELLPASLGNSIKQMNPPWASFVPAVIGLGLFTAARVAEQVGPASRRWRVAREWPAPRWASPWRRPIAACFCRWRSGSSCRR